MLACLMALLLCAAAFNAMPAETVVIDAFEYPDAATLHAAWVPQSGSPPAEPTPRASADGATAMQLPCPFTRGDIERACYDRAVSLDLTRAGAITFDFYCDDPEPISWCAIYFRSGAGWYAGSFGVERGWQRVSLSKGAFGIEGTPAGWGRVDTIRLSVWKGRAVDTWCAIDNLQARTEQIAVVRGLTETGESETAQRCALQIGRHLDVLGLPHGTLTDRDVERGALMGARIAIFAYSPSLSEAAVAQVRSFLEAGGKALVFYAIPEGLQDALGVRDVSYHRQEREGQFARLALNTPDIMGLPAAIEQGSWNVNTAQPAGHGARVIGRWRDSSGADQGPAAILSDRGFYLGHILTEMDPEGKQALLMALLGHFVPEIWEIAASGALDAAGRVGPFRSRSELDLYLGAVTPGASLAGAIAAHLSSAAEVEAQARALLEEGRFAEGLVAARRFREELVDAYLVAQTPREAEFRAVWNHSGTGDCGTWDEAMRRLKAGGFNAVVPNMWWGGVAHYASDLLPRSETFQEKGDQIAECVAAGKRYGIEVHPWKVNWNLSTAPEEFVSQMRAEGRLQATSSGEEILWLCPSDPRNLQLELDTMLEVAREYDVDGIHFDYIRYPHEDSCYCAGCRERFEAQRGEAVARWPDDCYSGSLRQEYRDWRCANITRLVKATAEAARRLKPWVKVSAAVWPDYPACAVSIGQDWVLWCRQGWLDFVCPMDYTESDRRLTQLVRNQVALAGGSVPVYAGIGAFIIPDDQVVGQIGLARANGADGFILFNMGSELAERGFPRFALGITSAPAYIPHNGPRVRFLTAYDSAHEPIVVREASLDVTVQVLSAGGHRKTVASIAGALELQDTAGRKLAELGPLPPVGAKVQVQVPRQAGAVRVAAVGATTYTDRTSEPFTVRSRPYGFAPQ